MTSQFFSAFPQTALNNPDNLGNGDKQQSEEFSISKTCFFQPEITELGSSMKNSTKKRLAGSMKSNKKTPKLNIKRKPEISNSAEYQK